MTGGFALGMAQTAVNPPDKAALVAVDQSSLCVWPGSLTWTCMSTSPGSLTTRPAVMQSTDVCSFGAPPTTWSAFPTAEQKKKGFDSFQTQKKHSISPPFIFPVSLRSVFCLHLKKLKKSFKKNKKKKKTNKRNRTTQTKKRTKKKTNKKKEEKTTK
jgi:hypothetical protein